MTTLSASIMSVSSCSIIQLNDSLGRIMVGSVIINNDAHVINIKIDIYDVFKHLISNMIAKER